MKQGAQLCNKAVHQEPSNQFTRRVVTVAHAGGGGGVGGAEGPCHHRGAHDTRVNHKGARATCGGAHNTRGNHEGEVEQLGLTHMATWGGRWRTTRTTRRGWASCTW